MGAASTFSGTSPAVEVAVGEDVIVHVEVGVGDSYPASAVWLMAAQAVSNHGVAGVPVDVSICRPPATMGVRLGSSVIVAVNVGVALGRKTKNVGVAVFVAVD